jgi:probable phosphoglycerate mutase
MVGLKEDLPLVQKGGEQAEALGIALREQNKIPTVVICGELRRHRRFAEIVMEQLGIPGEPIIDARLNEVDYGPWGGLSDAEVEAKFGPEELQAWRRDRVWPKTAGWKPAEDLIKLNVRSFALDCAKFAPEKRERILAISSGGILRYFLDLVPGAWEKQHLAQMHHVKTGRVCKIQQDSAGAMSMAYWNIDPATGEAL